MRVPIKITSLLLFLLVVGCQSRRGGSPQAAASEAQSKAGTPPTTEAGMCPEHGVLEAVCTKCNPKLIPIFQSKGDWCAEHEFPESFCPVCHPELEGKPRSDVAKDEAPADGTRVKFATKRIAEEVGIETTQAQRGDEEGTLVATAILVADASKSALVNSRFPGVIVGFQADIGMTVEKGAPLAVIESMEVADSRARLQSGRAHLESAKANHDRAEALHEKGILSAKEVQSAKQELLEAQAEVAAASAVVGLVGDHKSNAGMYTLVAPIRGVVTARRLTVGTQVDLEETIFEILDTTSLWAEIDIPESQSRQVRVGQKVLFEIDGLSDRSFPGNIRYLAPIIDARTRTIRARAALENHDGALRANMYARARIFISPGRGTALIPRAALQEAKGVHLVFVPLAIDVFEARRIQVGPFDDEFVRVTDGLLPGEWVVTTGSFLLKTETLKENIGAGCCDVEPGT